MYTIINHVTNYLLQHNHTPLSTTKSRSSNPGYLEYKRARYTLCTAPALRLRTTLLRAKSLSAQYANDSLVEPVFITERSLRSLLIYSQWLTRDFKGRPIRFVRKLIDQSKSMWLTSGSIGELIDQSKSMT
jgi:hypothetical protein